MGKQAFLEQGAVVLPDSSFGQQGFKGKLQNLRCSSVKKSEAEIMRQECMYGGVEICALHMQDSHEMNNKC